MEQQPSCPSYPQPLHTQLGLLKDNQMRSSVARGFKGVHLVASQEAKVCVCRGRGRLGHDVNEKRPQQSLTEIEEQPSCLSHPQPSHTYLGLLTDNQMNSLIACCVQRVHLVVFEEAKVGVWRSRTAGARQRKKEHHNKS